MVSNKKAIWSISFIVVFAVFFVVTLTFWDVSIHYNPDPDQIIQVKNAYEYLDKYWLKTKPDLRKDDFYFIPTGLFVETLEFRDSNTVYLSGYVWQKYDKQKHKNLSRGVIFPEGTKIHMQEAYRRSENNLEIIGWYFETEISETFNYNKFPFDHKLVWVRMWHKELDKNIILVPDLDSYDSTLAKDKFGLDPEIALSGYHIKETFFKYKQSNYDTNFGLKNNILKNQFPELYYNVALQRNLSDSVIVYLLPLSVVFVLLFFAMLIITPDEKRISLNGFNLSNMVRIGALLMFIIILSHIQLRGQVFAETIMYIEYIYFLAYLSILWMVVFSFIVGHKLFINQIPWIYNNNAALIKSAFLPVLLICILIATLVLLH